MKKILTLAVVLLLVMPLLLTGCDMPWQKKEETSETTEEVATKKTGILIEASNHVVSIQSPDGTTYTFFVGDDTVVEGTEKLGNTVEVSFDGEYTEGMNAKTVTTIQEVKEEQTTPPKHEGSTGTTTKPEDIVRYATGEVLSLSGNSIKFVARINGLTYNIATDGNTKRDEGIADGDIVRVIHKGNLKDGIVATKISIVARKADNNTYTIIGTVKDASMNQISLDEEGYVYEFKKTDDSTVEAANETVGKKVEITFKGDILNEPTIIKIDAK